MTPWRWSTAAVRYGLRLGRFPRSVVALGGLVLAVGACGTPSNTPSSSTAESATAPASTSETVAAPARVARADVPAPLKRNAATVYYGCDGGFGQAPQKVAAFDTETGKFQEFPIPAPPAGEELVNQACTVTSINGKPRAIYVVTTKKPSEGLTPESERTQIHAYDMGNPKALTVDWPANVPAEFRSIVPTDGGFLGMGGLYTKNLVASFDAGTLALRASVPAFEDGLGPSMDHNFDGYAVTHKRDVRIYNSIDGAEVGQVPDVGGCGDGTCVQPTDHGFVITRDKGAGIFYFDMRTKQLRGPLDLKAGVPADWFDSPARISPDNDITSTAGGSQYGDDVLLSVGRAFTVYDTASGATKFSLGKAKVDELNVGQADLGGQYLYLTKEPDNPVIDYVTSKTVSSGWKVRPLLKLPGGWVLIQPSRADGRTRIPIWPGERPATTTVRGSEFRRVRLAGPGTSRP